MAKVTKRTATPCYAAAAVWVLYALLFPLHKFGQFFFVALVSAAVFFVFDKLCGTVKIEVAEKPKEPETTGNAELDKMLHDSELAIAEMKRLDEAIEDEKISADIVRLQELCGKITAQVKADPSKLPQIRRFMDYYLPTTLKILNAYDRMGAQGVQGENISSTMQRVESMMSTIVTAFEKQLDALFGEQALDISSDITVLENLMAREGLTEQPLKAEAVDDPAEGIRLEL